MNYRKMLEFGVLKLEEEGIHDAAYDARVLMEELFHLPYGFMLTKGDQEVSLEDEQQYREVIEKRAKRIPLQHILGYQEFMGFRFFVNEHVLTPRQDTEILVEEGVSLIKAYCEHYDIYALNILDMCCGSGCIGISVAKILNEENEMHEKVEDEQKSIATSLTLCDVSKDALFVADKNRENLLSENVTIIESDLFMNVDDVYDVIFSNPPYIRSDEIDLLDPEVVDHEPRIALDGYEDGLYFYRRIVSESKRYLKKNGMLCFEIGYDQALDVKELMVKEGYQDIRVIKDLAGLDRVVIAHL